MSSGRMKLAWAGIGDPLEFFLFAGTAYQAYWALSELSDGATGALEDKITAGGLVVLVMLLGNVLVVRLPSMGGVQKTVSIPIIVAVMGISIITSQLHFATMMHGGYMDSIKNSDASQRASIEHTLSVQSLKTALASAQAATTAGEFSDAGYFTRKAEAAKADMARAQSNIARAISEDGEGGSQSSAIAKTAQLFDMTPLEFATWLAIIISVVMEIGRIVLTWTAGQQMRRAVDIDLGNDRAPAQGAA